MGFFDFFTVYISFKRATTSTSRRLPLVVFRAVVPWLLNCTSLSRIPLSDTELLLDVRVISFWYCCCFFLVNLCLFVCLKRHIGAPKVRLCTLPHPVCPVWVSLLPRRPLSTRPTRTRTLARLTRFRT